MKYSGIDVVEDEEGGGIHKYLVRGREHGDKVLVVFVHGLGLLAVPRLFFLLCTRLLMAKEISHSTACSTGLYLRILAIFLILQNMAVLRKGTVFLMHRLILAWIGYICLTSPFKLQVEDFRSSLQYGFSYHECR